MNHIGEDTEMIQAGQLPAGIRLSLLFTDQIEFCKIIPAILDFPFLASRVRMRALVLVRACARPRACRHTGVCVYA